MRPLALVAILAALAGCSLNYQGKTFGAIEKPRHMAAGEEHVVADHENETGSQPAGEPDGTTPPQGGENAPNVPTSSAFPNTAQPTGRPPVIESGADKPEAPGETSEHR